MVSHGLWGKVCISSQDTQSLCIPLIFITDRYSCELSWGEMDFLADTNTCILMLKLILFQFSETTSSVLTPMQLMPFRLGPIWVLLYLITLFLLSICHLRTYCIFISFVHCIFFFLLEFALLDDRDLFVTSLMFSENCGWHTSDIQ